VLNINKFYALKLHCIFQEQERDKNILIYWKIALLILKFAFPKKTY